MAGFTMYPNAYPHVAPIAIFDTVGDLKRSGAYQHGVSIIYRVEEVEISPLNWKFRCIPVETPIRERQIFCRICEKTTRGRINQLGNAYILDCVDEKGFSHIEHISDENSAHREDCQCVFCRDQKVGIRSGADINRIMIETPADVDGFTQVRDRDGTLVQVQNDPPIHRAGGCPCLKCKLLQSITASPEIQEDRNPSACIFPMENDRLSCGVIRWDWCFDEIGAMCLTTQCKHNTGDPSQQCQEMLRVRKEEGLPMPPEQIGSGRSPK